MVDAADGSDGRLVVPFLVVEKYLESVMVMLEEGDALTERDNALVANGCVRSYAYA